MSDIDKVFDDINKPIMIDHSKMDKSLDDVNNQIFNEIMAFKEFNDVDASNLINVQDDNTTEGMQDNELLQMFKKLATNDSLQNQSKNADLENEINLEGNELNIDKELLDATAIRSMTDNKESARITQRNGSIGPDSTAAQMYKMQFLKSLKLIQSLKAELDEYKKMGRVSKYLNDDKMNLEVIKDYVADDVKLIISDLQEQFQTKENEEMTIIQDNFKKLIKFMDKQYHHDFEMTLDKLLQTKNSKANVFKDFTDKIITTIEEVAEENFDPSALDEMEDELEDGDGTSKNIDSGRLSFVDSSKGKRKPRMSMDLLNKSGMLKFKGKQDTSLNLKIPILKKFKHIAFEMMTKIQSKRFIRDFMPKSQLFSVITQIHKIARDYLEKTHPEMPLYCFVYDYFSNKYGIKKIADKKFKQMCATIRRIKDSNQRSYVFGRFMAIFDPLERSDFQK